MTISSTTSRADYTGNGSVDTYAYGFKVFDQGDLLVIVRDTDGAETTLTITTHYTVTGVGNASGGNVVLVNGAFDWLDGDGDLKTGYHLTIRRVADIVQETDLRNQGAFFPEVYEEALDKLVIIEQQQQDEIGRSMKMAETVSPASFSPTLPAELPDNPGATMIVNPAGTGFIIGPTADAIANADSIAQDAQDAADDAEAAAIAAQAAAASIMWNDVVFITSADSPYSVTSSHRGKMICVDATGGAVSITLPAIAGLDLSTAYVVGIKKTDAGGNAVTVTRASSDTIDGATSKVISLADSGAAFIPDTTPSPDEWTTANFGDTSTPADGSVTTAKIVDANVTKAKLANGAKNATVATATTTHSVADTTDLLLCSASGGAFTVTLPAAASHSGRILSIKKTDSSLNAVTIDGNASETIDGATTTRLSTQYESVDIICDGTNWHIAARRINTSWTNWTPTGSWSTNTSYSGRWRRVGDTGYYDVFISLAGAPTSATLTIDLPSGHTIDTAKIGSTDLSSVYLGRCACVNTGTAVFDGPCFYESTTTVRPRYSLTAAGEVLSNNITQSTPFTFGNTDTIHVRFSAPIENWNG